MYNIWSTQSILVYFSLFWSTSVYPVLLVYFGDTLGGEDFVKRGAASFIIMLQSQPNVSRFFIKLHFSCIIKVLYLFYYISDRFTYICFFLDHTRHIEYEPFVKIKKKTRNKFQPHINIIYQIITFYILI